MADLVAPIGTAELAKKIGRHRKTAWARLKKIRAEKGDAVVTQDGPRRPLRTSLRALFHADPHLVQLRELEREEIEAVVAARFRTRTAALEKRNAELDEKVKSLELQVNELRETTAILFRGLRLVANGGAGDSKG